MTKPLLNYCLVTQNLASIIEDSAYDADRYPDVSDISGEVIFTPNVANGKAYQLFDNDGKIYTVPVSRVQARIINGEIRHENETGVYLFAAGPGSNPDKITYSVEYRNLRSGGLSFSLSPLKFEAIPGGEIDLTTVTPVAGATPAGTVRGPRGVSLESIVVDGSELVFMASDDERIFEIARIPLEEVVRAEADAAAVVAADVVRDEVRDDADRAESAANRADTRVDSAINNGASLVRNAVKKDADRAESAASSAASDTAVALREEMKSITQANAVYMGQSIAASHVATDSANALKDSLARLESTRAWFKGDGAPPQSIPGARSGDWWLDTSSMTLHEITGVTPNITSVIIGNLTSN